MERSGIELIQARDSKHLTLRPSEKIGKKYFFQYLLTQLKDHNIFSEEFSHYFYTFCKNTRSYEIIVLNTQAKDFIYEPFIFESFYKNDPAPCSVDLFVTKNFFSLFKNGRFLLCKLVDNAAKEELELFVSQTYSLNISNIHEINDKELKDLKQNYSQNAQKFKKLHDSNPFKYFLTFNITAVLLFVFLVAAEFKAPKKSAEVSAKFSYNHQEKIRSRSRQIIPSLVKILEHIKQNDIQTKSLDLRNGKYRIKLYHKDKKRLLDFNLPFERNKINIHSITFDKEYSNYMMDVTIEY